MPRKAYDENGDMIGDVLTPEEVEQAKKDAAEAAAKKARDEAQAEIDEAKRKAQPTAPAPAQPDPQAVTKQVDAVLASRRKSEEVARLSGGDPELTKRIEAKLSELEGLPEDTPEKAADKVAKAATLAGIGVRPRSMNRPIQGGAPPSSDEQLAGFDPELAAQLGVSREDFKKHAGKTKVVDKLPSISNQE